MALQLTKEQTVQLLKNNYTKLETNGRIYIVMKTGEDTTEVACVAEHSPIYPTSVQLDVDGIVEANKRN